MPSTPSAPSALLRWLDTDRSTGTDRVANRVANGSDMTDAQTLWRPLLPRQQAFHVARPAPGSVGVGIGPWVTKWVTIASNLDGRPWTQADRMPCSRCTTAEVAGG